MKRIFAKGPSVNLRLLAALLAAAALMAADHRGVLPELRAALVAPLYPLQQAVNVPIRMVEKLWEAFSSYTALVKDNQRLKDEQTFLKTRLLTYAALEKENIRLRTLLDTTYKLGEQLLVAELLAVQMDPYQHVVTINKGSRFGIRKAQPVLDENGIIGQVLRVAPFTAEVILITDPNHAVPVQVVRNGLLTVAVGAGRSNQVLLPYLPNNADIEPGDLLVTSGLGGVFPAGYPVASVATVMPQSGRPFALVTAKPLAKLDRSRELLIAWNRDRSKIEAGENAAPEAAQPVAPASDARR
ncbi:MAG TPA: rod shape-determining protein MreC [Methylococcaceae bacterium]|nr:rod shape-determining protein MreC [Methylococcaceae bacterium]